MTLPRNVYRKIQALRHDPSLLGRCLLRVVNPRPSPGCPLQCDSRQTFSMKSISHSSYDRSKPHRTAVTNANLPLRCERAGSPDDARVRSRGRGDSGQVMSRSVV